MCPFTSQICPCTPRIAGNSPFIFQNCPSIFQECLFISWNWSFIFQKCFSFPGIALLFLKSTSVFLQNVLFFPEFTFNFPDVPFFIYCTYLISRIFFPADCTFAAFYSELLREITFALPSFCFLLELFIDQYPRRQSHVQS